MNYREQQRCVIGLGLVCLVVSACGSPANPPTAAAPVATAGTITISEPRVRLPALGQDQTAAYLTMFNAGKQPDRLLSATSPDAQKLELHAHIKSSDGMMMMRQVQFIDVPAGATIPLVPGGLHIMVKRVKRDIKIGETLPIELTFASGAKAAFNLPIVANPSTQVQGQQNNKQGHQH